ncbi:hypothetical protein ACP4OV_031884 [Aristida adscensionis]
MPMLPSFSNNSPLHHYHHHYHPRNPTVASLLMPATTSWGEYYGGGQIFPADMYDQDTLEAVLRQPVTATSPQAHAAAAAEGQPRMIGPSAEGRRRVAGATTAAAAAATARKRPARTDRHSKICTAQGVRDRRMRLSVGVARDFFALQDRLGFDKASKTVHWLLTQSKPAIDRLSHGAAAAPAAREKGEGSSSSTGFFGDATPEATLRPTEKASRSSGGEDGLLMSGAAVAAAATEQPQLMAGLESYYQYYQLEEMMRSCSSNGGVLPTR